MLATVASSVLLFLAACVVALNWRGVITSYRLKRQGSLRNVSLIYVVAQILVFVAAVISFRVPFSPLPSWLFLVVALADPALLSIAYLPVFLLRGSFVRKSN